MKKVLLSFFVIFCITQIGRSQVFYNLNACAYSPIAGAGTAIPTGDDVVSGAIPIGFNFVFYGAPFTQCYVGSNGWLSFNAGMGSGCCSGGFMPAAGFPTMIAWSWDDMYTVGGNVNYFTSGVAPNRIFVLNYQNVGYCCTSANMATCQIQLYETTNEIRILSANNNHIGRTATMGIQMIGQGSTVVPGRNAASWASAANECYSFLPGIPPPPPNDNPCTAIALTVSAACTYVPTTNISATNTAGPPAPGCAGYGGGDVWYSAVVPATGSITFDTQTGVMLDGGMAVYSGTCAAMVLIACDDNSSPNGNMPMISLTGQTPGATLWIRVWENGNNNNGSFSICAYDPPPPLCYTQTVIAYAPDAAGGTNVVLSDDAYSGAANIGFNFCFDGTTYTQCLISSNGYIDFNLASSGMYSPWPIPAAIPTNNPTEIQSTILGPWQDLYPPGGGTITYQTLGVAPNRRFVITWNNVPMFSCTGLLDRQQIKLFEGSNCIEFHIGDKPLCAAWNSGQAIQGLNNWNGVMASPVAGRNAPTQWTATNDALRMAPTCTPCSTAIVCTVPLPIELVNLHADCIEGEAKIIWTTSSQINNEKFTIEKSEDGVNYVEIGKIPGAGNSNEILTYSFIDNDTRSTLAYYRLKQTDYDGNFEYFDPVSIQCDGSNISVIPNPNDGIFQVLGVKANSIMYITDLAGKIVYQLNNPPTQVEIDLNHLSIGIYYMQIESGSEKTIKKIIVQ